MKILVTGAAGFIGSAISIKLLVSGYEVIGVDNHSDYYDLKLKEDRVNRNLAHKNYQHFRIDIKDGPALDKIFASSNIDYVINLAAQAGVRYSIENPLAYIDSNICGFANILECCRHHKIKHLVYASSSSVYGSNTLLPFSTVQNTDHPVSLYAATKKANELMAHSYSHLYHLPTTGLRLFTVYGPWGRPDMALFKFTKSILNNEKIQLFNGGSHSRDFTYIDDVVESIFRVIDHIPQPNTQWDGANPNPSSSNAPWRIYNLGNSSPVKLMAYVEAIELAVGKRAKIELLPMQMGDVLETYADIESLVEEIDYRPQVSVKEGVSSFVKWFKQYYSI
jgi:UDP-glucuronate 4-epimerase